MVEAMVLVCGNWPVLVGDASAGMAIARVPAMAEPRRTVNAFRINVRRDVGWVRMGLLYG
jgi:hypothetical protein